MEFTSLIAGFELTTTIWSWPWRPLFICCTCNFVLELLTFIITGSHFEAIFWLPDLLVEEMLNHNNGRTVMTIESFSKITQHSIRIPIENISECEELNTVNNHHLIQDISTCLIFSSVQNIFFKWDRYYLTENNLLESQKSDDI